MAIWSAEIKELEKLHESVKGQVPVLEKELEQLIHTTDANVIMLYSRRCLEVIITDLCECELKRPRKTEPLKGIIDKLHKEEKIPSHIISSMHGLNELSTYGAHPKDFDPEQVRPVLVNLDIIIKWYLKHKETGTGIKAKHTEEISSGIKRDANVRKGITISRKRLAGILGGSIGVVAFVFAVLYFSNIIGSDKQPKEIEKSIAVLPFRNLSNDTSQLYFSDGIVEAILDHLFKVGELKVISGTSTKRYRGTELSIKEIAKELGVASILEGSVQKIGNNIRITAQLIDAKTDVHLWSETYDKDLSDIFLIQTEVAQNVAKELKATLTLEETILIKNSPSTTNQLAYDFYLKGNDYWSKANSLLALDMYSKAIQEDSLFATAYAKRALMHLFIWWNKVEEWQGHDLNGKEDIERGEQINPGSLDIKFVKAVACYWVDRDYDKSIVILKELKTKAPNMADLYAFVSYNLRRQGKWEQSVIEAKRSIQLDPFNAQYIENLSQTYDLLHQYDKMIENSRQGLSLIPDYKGFNNGLFNAYLKKTADLNVALTESGFKAQEVQYDIYYYSRQYDNLIEFISFNTATQSNQFNYSLQPYIIAKIYHLNGNKTLCKINADSAIKDLNEKLKKIPNDDRMYATLGKCYALSGNFKEAITCGKKAVDLKPIKLDAYQGAIREQELMEIYLFTGNYDLALDKIEFLLSVPSWLSVGSLIIDPIFDDLRNLPRFQKIIDSAKK
jgi:serine/threonine-protein kinase